MLKNMLKNRFSNYIFFIGLSFFVIFISLCIGSVNVPFGEVMDILKYNLFQVGEVNKGLNGIIWQIRAPRVLAAFLVGGGLAISGATIQSLFQNPMADPGILGISSGASLGAIISIALGLSSIFLIATPLFAIGFAFLAGILVYNLGTHKGKSTILGLILSGIALSTFMGAVNSLILSNLGDGHAREYIFWAMGSLSGRHWEHIYFTGAPIIILSFLLVRYYKELNILLLGEEQSYSLGIDVVKFRKKILMITSSIVALSVCISGNIGFVGLVVPHILRRIWGSDNKVILPRSFFLGGIFLVLADLLSRTVVAPKELSAGIITSLLGAPYFMYLLTKYKKEEI